MGELVFIGLGLHDERGITLQGLEAAKACDVLFEESYTSAMPGTTLATEEALLGKPVRRLNRAQVESGGEILQAAARGRVGFLVPGDPMAATTHVDLRLRAQESGIPTRVIHGVSIVSAAAGTVGLQAYKFGRTTTVPFPSPGFAPTSPLEVIRENRRAGLHTLVLLDLKEDGTFLDPKAALLELLDMVKARGASGFGRATLVCVLSRVGSPEGRAVAGPLGEVLTLDLGPPLHCIVVPGELHFLEKRALAVFAGLPHDP